MTPRIQQLKAYILDRKHHAFRRSVEWHLAEEFSARKLSHSRRAVEALKAMLAAETPVFLPDERIVYTRTVREVPERYTEAEMAELRSKAYYHEKGVVFNMTPDYGSVLSTGLQSVLDQIDTRLQTAQAEQDAEGIEFLTSARESTTAVLDLADRYAQAARNQGLTEIADILSRVPRHGAQTFREALQLLRILHYTMWCEGEYHNGFGRFDQYMLPFYEADLAKGRLTEEQAFELIEEFFLSANRDSDLYVGVQQGDNGQSMMLGGCTRDGQNAVNALTTLCLKASCELKLIDPKINLRVTADTPLELLELGTELTKQGLGFPQYSNDDIVIPALQRYGYALEDARDYTVAACWEFIIPGCGMDIPNIAALSYPKVIDTAMRKSQATSFEEFLEEVKAGVTREADAIRQTCANVQMLPGPFVSTMCTGRIAAARDVCKGNRYNNFGVHGTGLATAVDSLMAVKKEVFDEKRSTMAELVAAMDTDFASQPELLADVRYHTPKMGNDIDEVDSLASVLLNAFDSALSGKKNCRGGVWRCGTGSAMYYIWHANELPASADGRLKGQPFPANYAPSLNVQVKGPVSIVRSFTKPDLKQVCNGGPLTLEIHDSAFREADGVRKVAQLVSLFCKRGGHQLQLNAVNSDKLKDAQLHPENYRNLIVRVWGWSGYFIELDKPYQDHVIRRVELGMSGE